MKTKYLAGGFAALIVLLSLLSVGCQQAQMPEPGTDGLFFHISNNDAHRVIMPLNLGVKMLGEDVNMVYFFDVEGVRAVVKDAEAYTKDGFAMTSHEAIQKLLENDVGIYVCPMCLKAAGYTEDDLLDGIGIMKKEVFFGFTDGRILTLDY